MSTPFQALADELRGEHWLDEANCSALTAELFWVDKGGSVAPAKAICRDCPVKRQCLEWALTHNEREGVWGGLAPSERRSIHVGRPIPAPTLCINGHDLNRVGTRGSDGYCKQCDRERWQRYKNRQKQGLVAPRKPRKRERVDITDPAAHGLHRHNLGCRCLICCDANAEKQRNIRARKREQRALSIVEDAS